MQYSGILNINNSNGNFNNFEIEGGFVEVLDNKVTVMVEGSKPA
jgi:F0F1-type ATP synthase epsilon subunit